MWHNKAIIYLFGGYTVGIMHITLHACRCKPSAINILPYARKSDEVSW